MLATSSPTFEQQTLCTQQSKSKKEEEPEIQLLKRPNPLIAEFDHPRFSDISLVGFGKCLKLHKMILAQSPYLSSKVDGADLIFIELADWPVMTKIGMEAALKDLYHFGDKVERDYITRDNVFACFLASCLLELQSLAQYCTFMIQEQMCHIDQIIDMVGKLEEIKPLVSDSEESNHKMHSKYYLKLHNSLLGSILHAVSMCSKGKAPLDQVLTPGRVFAPSLSTPVHASLFLAQLPLKWIESVLCAHQLPIECEFDRYELAKAIFKLRSNAPDIMQTVSASLASTQLDDNEDTETVTEQSLVLRGADHEKENARVVETKNGRSALSVASSIMNFFTSSGKKKRKLDSEEEEGDGSFKSVPSTTVPEIEKRPIAQPKSRSNSSSKKSHSPLKLPATLSNIYENGIVYTYMNFAQLGVVKKDEIVPLHVALESYWLQAELLNVNPESLTDQSPDHDPELQLRPFRFGVKFENVSAYFRRTPRPAVMASESVTCAGVQYRLLLSLEQEGENEDEHVLKALLQKSKGRGPSVSYSIYMFDHRAPLERHSISSCLEPITLCKSDGEGYANSFPLAVTKSEAASCPNSIYLSIALYFSNARSGN